MADQLFPKGMQAVLERLLSRANSGTNTATASADDGRYPLVEEILHYPHIFPSYNAGTSWARAQRTAKSNGGYLPTIPNLVAAMAQTTNNWLWDKDHYGLTEQSIGVDEEGKYGKKGEVVIVTLHGTSFGTAKQLEDQLDKHSQRLDKLRGYEINQGDFDALLRFSRMPDGTFIHLYTIEQAMKGEISHPFGHLYGIIMSADMAKEAEGKFAGDKFENNSVAIALAGTPATLSGYYLNALKQDLGTSSRKNQYLPDLYVPYPFHPIGRSIDSVVTNHATLICVGKNGFHHGFEHAASFFAVVPKTQ